MINSDHKTSEFCIRKGNVSKLFPNANKKWVGLSVGRATYKKTTVNFGQSYYTVFTKLVSETFSFLPFFFSRIMAKLFPLFLSFQ